MRIDLCSRRITPQLENAGYDVQLVEFEGGHAVPAGIARRALAWFTEDQGGVAS
ncbi:MAG: hypothetical protein JOZ41_18420 [Chloroflexi bacterium]|nr:hypothetical protein [Chloroflexota bacterium]